MLFRQIVFYALFVGLLSGIVLTVVQTWQVVPIIKSAEMYESEDSGYSHGNHDDAADISDHHHGAKEWTPEDSLERTVYTFLSNIITAIGFALLIMAAIVAANRLIGNSNIKLSWRHGLAWGTAGYLVFWLIPAIGMPPEIPLAATAPLEERQIWWVITAVCTAVGLAGLAFGKSPWRWVSPLLLIVPFIIGAPHPGTEMFADQPANAALALEALAQQFIGATAIANAIFWIVLGLVSIWSVQRMKFSSD